MTAQRFFQTHAIEEPWHVTRFLRSWEWLRPLVHKEQRILECGGAGPFTAWLRRQHLRVDLTGVEDLREPLTHPSDDYDLILLMEVIEHLKDRVDSERTTFHGSGIRMCLSELYRVAKPHALLFLTTPNLGCFHTIRRILDGKHPFQYPLHPRELSPDEVLAYLKEAGWQPIKHATLDVWDGHGVTDQEKLAILELHQRLGGTSPWLSGDCLFVVARKG